MQNIIKTPSLIKYRSDGQLGVLQMSLGNGNYCGRGLFNGHRYHLYGSSFELLDDSFEVTLAGGDKGPGVPHLAFEKTSGDVVLVLGADTHCYDNTVDCMYVAKAKEEKRNPIGTARYLNRNFLQKCPEGFYVALSQAALNF